MQILGYTPSITSFDQASPFIQLPQEVHLAILSNLTQSQDFCSTRLICKHFNQIFSDDSLWKIFYQKIYPRRKFNPTFSYQTQFQTLHKINRNWERGLASLVEIKPNSIEAGLEIENSEIHAKGSRIFHINCNKSIEVRDINSGTLEKTLEGISGVDVVQIKSSAQLLTAWFGEFECCHDLKIWSLNELTFLGTVKNCLSDYKILGDFIIGKEYAMTYDRNPQLTVWNTKGERLVSLGDAKFFEVTPDHFIYVDGNFLKIVSSKDYNPLKEIRVHKATSLTVNDHQIILGHENGNVSLYNKSDGSFIQEIEANVHTSVLAVHAIKDFLIIKYVHEIKTWNRLSESFASTFKKLSYSYLVENDRLFMTLQDGSVEIRNIHDSELLHLIPSEQNASVIKLTTDEDRIYVQDQKHLRIFNKDTSILLLKIACKAFTLEGYRLITWADQKIHIRDYS